VSATAERWSAGGSGLARACGRTLWIAWVALLPIALAVFVVQSLRNGHSSWAIDFHGNFRGPARELLRGDSPYHPAELERVRAAVAAGHSPIEFRHGVFAAYPAPGLLVGVPFTAVPGVVAEWLWLGVLVACGGLALRLAGVRDRRVLAAALLAPMVVSSLWFGAVDLVLALGLAACWRWRDHAGRAGLALGAIVALKLVALPLLAWLLATRRWRAAAAAAATAGVLLAAGWALIGFDGLAGYPHLLSVLADVESDRGYSAVAFAGALGLGSSTASLAPYAAGACALAALALVVRRGGREADAVAFLLGVLAALAFSPIVWQHSLALLLVPLAVLRPRFGAVWTLPVLLWLTPDTAGVVPVGKLLLAAAVVAALCLLAVQPGGGRRRVRQAIAAAGTGALA
jgi:hypothetical protein